MSSSDADRQLEVFFFPFTAYGHMIPIIDMAKLFAARGVKATLLLTPHNASIFSESIDRERSLSGLDINIQILGLPFGEAGLPQGIENIDDIRNQVSATTTGTLEKHRPDFIVADMFLTFATEAASKYGIPRFVFHGTGFFPQCIEETLVSHKTHEGITSDGEIFVVRESEKKSYWIPVNSFYSLCNALQKCSENRNNMDKAQRVKKTWIDEHFVVNWLDSKEPHSVLYICFGSMYSRLSKA
ncbi:hypothetical protein MKX03_019157 [Papaver bracteatum]|nr:hypothetical protein MKX03_019157 [Papaver bracteatum]